KRYSSMIQMLRDFDREDLETLWKLVKSKHGSTRPEEGYERLLWGDLRTMFEHYIEDTSVLEVGKEDAHVTLTAIHDTQKIEVPMQSSSVSSDFTKKLLNFENISPTDNEIASLMDTTVHHEEPSGQTYSLFTVPITVIPEITSAFTTTIPPPPPSFNPLPQQATPTPTQQLRK
ncbi:hypothetical protein Tco_0254975, partial [Tanacetum coccineum]